MRPVARTHRYRRNTRFVRERRPLVQKRRTLTKNAITPTHAATRPKTGCRTLYFFHFVKEQCLKHYQGLSTTDAHRASALLNPSHPLADGAAGGAGRDRTDDPRLAKPMLSQLSYSPRIPIPWWVWLGSNQRPPPYQDGALTS